MQIIHTNKSKEKNAPSKINKTEIPQNNKNSNDINSHNKIYDSSNLQDKKISTKIKPKKKEPILENLLIKDLDEFFKNIYNYYYNKGYNNILTQIILDNISYLFSIHFVILNIFIINWKEIILKCTVDNLCNSELSNNFSIQNFSEKISEHFFLFLFIYGFLIIYYLIFFFKSILQIINMKRIKNIYDYRLKIKQSELEHIKFDQIIHRLIILQDKESFCRIKENLTKYDIISRIMRKDNYMLALFTNNIIDSKIKFSLKIPFLQKKIFDFNFEIFSNFLYTKINESVIDFALNSMDKRVNVNFISLQTLRFKLIFFMFCECIFLIPSIFLKIIFWIFINADNIKSNRNITNKIWDRKNLILFRNYNELQHYFDYRITTSYKYLELFNNCFKSKQRLFNIVKRFLKLITGSILFIIFMISFFDNRLLTDMTIFGKNFVWLSIIVGVIISITNSEEEKDLKENPYTCLSDKNDKKFLSGNYLDCDNRVVYYKKLINCLINIPEEWNLAENFSKVNKEINNNYEMSFLMIVKEILSMIFFPLVWVKLIFNADEIRKFIIKNSCNFPDLGTICCFSYFNFENYKKNRAGSSRFVDYNFNDKKFLNSCFYYKNVFYGKISNCIKNQNNNPNKVNIDDNSDYNNPQNIIVKDKDQKLSELEIQEGINLKFIKLIEEKIYFNYFSPKNTNNININNNIFTEIENTYDERNLLITSSSKNTEKFEENPRYLKLISDEDEYYLHNPINVEDYKENFYYFANKVKKNNLFNILVQFIKCFG